MATLDSNEMSATLKQGLQYKQKQNKLKNKYRHKHAVSGASGQLLHKDGIEGFSQNTSSVEQTKQILQKTRMSPAQIQEIQQLQNTFNSLVNQLNVAQNQLGTATDQYIGLDAAATLQNVKVTSLNSNPTSTYIGDYMQGSGSASGLTTVNGGQNYTYNTCQTVAASVPNTPNFALQNVNSSGKANCAIGTAASGSLQQSNKAVRYTRGADGFIYGGVNTNAIYSAPNAQYVGTFWDMGQITGQRSMSNMAPGGQSYTYAQCMKYAADNNYPLFGLQYTNGQVAQCFTSNNWTQTTQGGNANNQSIGPDGYTYGGGWSNSVYYINPSQVNSSGYQGSYNDNQPNKVMNPLGGGGQTFTYATCQAAAQKLGSPYFALQNYNPSTGKAMCLVNNNWAQMTQYGPATTSVKESDGKQYGTQGINSVYSLNQMGIQANMGKVGYLDEYSQLSPYPASMINANGSINNSPSCSKTINEIDSLQWQKYSSSGNQMTPTTACGLKKAVAPSMQTVNGIKAQLSQVAAELVQKLTTLEINNVDLDIQIGTNVDNLAVDLGLYKSIANKYANINIKNINGITNESNTRTLQENYTVILWTVLAITLIAITIHFIRR